VQVLILSTVWPEPTSSAAGSRMMQLIASCIDESWSVCYASTASLSPFSADLEHNGVSTATIILNNPSFDMFIQKLNPDMVIFDRYMVEEQFGWRVAQHCPEALRVLDSEDLHCLRKTRAQTLKTKTTFSKEMLFNDHAFREIASMYRCDLTLVISEFEMELLHSFFKVPEQLLLYLPFLLEKITKPHKNFDKREHFVTIGNFLHPPNWDSIQYLKMTIWPLIRKQLPRAEMHIYGAYPSPKVQQLHKEQEGFLIKGRAKDAYTVVENARVLLAPLRFGAGLKGKLIDAMCCGTPNVTTSIGAEGIAGTLLWSGAIEDEASAFAKAAIELYTNESSWQTAQEAGIQIINSRFSKTEFKTIFISSIQTIRDHLKSHRQTNFTGAMLHHHTLQSTKYLSKWIEWKNKD